MINRFEHFSLAIAEISRCWRKLATEEMAKYGLRAPHATYLTSISRYPEGISVPELCELSGKDKSDASRMIAILEEKGMVKKISVDGSMYRGKLILTELGQIAAGHVQHKASLAVELAGRDLDDESREIFYRALDSITANLTELSKTGIPERKK